jgi:hypothetical protein
VKSPTGEKPNGLMGPMATLDISDKRDNPAHEKISEGTSSETSDEMRNSGGNCKRYGDGRLFGIHSLPISIHSIFLLQMTEAGGGIFSHC